MTTALWRCNRQSYGSNQLNHITFTLIV